MTELERPTPGMHPAEGRNDLPLPGAGEPSDATDAPLPGPTMPLRDIADEPVGTEIEGREAERRDELADQAGVGMPGPATHHPDVLPDVEPPDNPM